MVREFATDFVPPQKAGDSGGESDGGTGLYCGEQDMFCVLIDPTGWAEINGEAFAPGFFVWNSEVGKRSVGVQTFWFQAVCQNHIVWDAVEVVDFSRKHTANVYESVADIRGIIARLVQKRGGRRDGFVQVVKKAMETRLGSSSAEVLKVLAKQGITRTLAKEAPGGRRQARGSNKATSGHHLRGRRCAHTHLRQARQRGRAKRGGPEGVGTAVAGQVVTKLQRPLTTGSLLSLFPQR